MSEKSFSTRLSCGSRVLDLSRPHVMGILNVTPDSFSDGGQHVGVDAALRHAERMIAAGATLVDVGGESTRPATNFPGISLDSYRFDCLVKKSGLGVKP